MTVMVALDGASAMRIVDQITPDIVLLDAVMPGMDGFETCKRLKRDAGLVNVPIIFMTGLAGDRAHRPRARGRRRRLRDKADRDRGMLARIRVHLAQRAADTKRTRRTRCLRPLSPRSEWRCNNICACHNAQLSANAIPAEEIAAGRHRVRRVRFVSAARLAR